MFIFMVLAFGRTLGWGSMVLWFLLLDGCERPLSALRDVRLRNLALSWNPDLWVLRFNGPSGKSRSKLESGSLIGAQVQWPLGEIPL